MIFSDFALSCVILEHIGWFLKISRLEFEVPCKFDLDSIFIFSD